MRTWTLILLLLAGPFAIVWSVNVLCDLPDGITFWKWLAALLLLSILKCEISGKIEKAVDKALYGDSKEQDNDKNTD